MKNEIAERLLQLYDELDVGVLVISLDSGIVLFSNRHVSKSIKRPPQEIQGQQYKNVFEREFEIVFDEVSEICRDGCVHTRVFFWEKEFLWEQMSVRTIEWPGVESAILLSITNVTDVSRSEYEHKQMAYYDGLLHLPNGLKLEEDMAAIHDYECAALIHFDIDRFSNINDMYGWETGDELLMQIRDWLMSTLRRTSALYRSSDDGFCLLIRSISLEEAKKRADEIMQRFSQPWEAISNEKKVLIYLTVEMGVVHGQYVQGDMRNILYRTTHAPKQRLERYALYDKEMDDILRQRVRLRQSLIDCILQEMKGFEVYYQPIVAAKDGQWIGAEALCRWVSPTGERIPPSAFIPEVESLGFISKLDKWVRETALRQCSEWGLNTREFFLDTNLSAVQPLTNEFIDEVLSTVDRLGYPREKLTLEFTESEKINFSEEKLNGLHHLRDAGIVLAIDDFGTGYSTFENLTKIPAGILKTERLMIENLENDSYSQYLMRMMVDMAHTVGMKLIAEGVETTNQEAILQSYGVDYLQGYLFSRPLPAEQFSTLIYHYTK